MLSHPWYLPLPLYLGLQIHTTMMIGESFKDPIKIIFPFEHDFSYKEINVTARVRSLVNDDKDGGIAPGSNERQSFAQLILDAMVCG